MERTAAVHIPHIEGHPGFARTFKLSHPLPDGHQFVTIWVQPSFGNAVGPEVVIIPATESGACAEPSIKRRPGSFVMHEEPLAVDATGNGSRVEHVIDGAYRMALMMLGGYGLEIEDAHP